MNPIIKPELQTIDSKEFVSFQCPNFSWTNMAHLEGIDENEEKLVTFEFPIKEMVELLK